MSEATTTSDKDERPPGQLALEQLIDHIGLKHGVTIVEKRNRTDTPINMFGVVVDVQPPHGSINSTEIDNAILDYPVDATLSVGAQNAVIILNPQQ